MDPNAGTFLSIDPLVGDAFDPQALNAYSYALNNPVSNVDPDGLSPNAVGAIVGAAGGFIGSIKGQSQFGGEVNGQQVVVATLVGAVVGAITPAGALTSIGNAASIGARANVVETVLNTILNALKGEKIDLEELAEEIAIAAATGAAAGALGGKIGRTTRTTNDDPAILNFLRSLLGETAETVFEGLLDEPDATPTPSAASGTNENPGSEGGGADFNWTPIGLPSNNIQPHSTPNTLPECGAYLC